MTNETRSRIRAYTEELPHMKEKVFGALLMLVIAACVAATSSYAWVTLSRSPEVSHIATSLAANGALEIALSKPDGSMPDEFDIDESVTGSSDVTVTNLQWGNLVNLSDASYGIDNMALRPAQLNTANLTYSPLWGAVYGEDGRITKLNSSYTYAKYNAASKEFLATKDYGVRAITSYITTTSDSTTQALNEKLDAVTSAKESVASQYNTVIGKFSTLGDLITRVAQDKVNGTDYAVDSTTDSNLASYLPSVRDFYVEMEKAMALQKDAYVALANLQLYQWSKANEKEFTAVAWSTLEQNRAAYNTANASTASSNGVIALTGLSQFVSDYNALKTDLSYLEKYVATYNANNKVEYYWSHGGDSGYQIVDIINRLISYGTMYLIIDGEEVPVGSLQSKAVELVTSSNKDYDVYVKNGILQRFEQSALDETARMNGNAQCNITIQAKVGLTITLNINGHAYSTATGSSYFALDLATTQNKSLDASDKVAEDTYGLAIDLWVRTNAEQTCLTLEGATSTDEQGNIVSYDGINRVWGHTGEAMLTTNSTTQGGGSCYVYYADTPEDMARSLDLLDAMKVAFVDPTGNGTLLATAEMDTANYWAVNGRITVPLVLDNQTKTTYNYVDDMNAEQVGRAITTLYTDLPIRVTAIVYLDGTRLTNDHVLAAAEIQGSLNIQFGSSLDLKTLGSNELVDDTRSVSASVSPNKLNYDTATSDADMTTKVTVNVEGVDPTNVTAFFVRAINSTQGTREPTMTFTKQSNGVWTCDYVFTAPGIYYLRQVRLDGVDYTLAEPQMVEVAGFGLNSVTWSETSENVTIQTSAGTHSTTVTVNFSSEDDKKLPTSVQARFVRDDGNTVNVPLTYNANGNWVGTGTFSASGTYQLQYLVANGNRYIDLALTDGSYRTMNLSLGMYVSVTDLSGGLVQEFDEEEAEKGVYAKNVAVRVYNNAGVELEELEGLKLFYSNGTSMTNTINTDLVWDELNHYYTGTLPIVNPGRYQFAFVTVGGNVLSKCTASPTYIIVSPDPPIYDETSACTLNVDGVQYVPLTNDAKIDGIVIENAASAAGCAVVYSAVSNSYYAVPMSYSGTSWSVNLPTYDGTTVVGEDANGDPIYEQLQDGRWSVAAIYLWDCYAYDEWHESTNPVLWVDSTLGSGYLSSDPADMTFTVSESTVTVTSKTTADATLDFSALTTDVSAKVTVRMNAGDTSLGGTSEAFGQVFPVSTATGMSVTLTDGVGRIIPKDKITDVSLNYSYSGNSDTSYGYKVSGYSVTDSVELNNQDGETGERTVSSSQTWIYVGKYTVNSLVITIGDKTLTYSGGDTTVGVPSAYTVTTAAPTADNILLDDSSWKQTVKEFGSTTDATEGAFLKAHNLSSTNVTIKLVGASGQSMSYAVLDGLSVNLILTHQGDSQTYGGYTFSGDTGYQNLTLAMTKNNNGVYAAPSSQTLLAGTYKVSMQITAGGKTETLNLDNITVWSMRPDVKIKAVSPGTSETVVVNKNTDKADNHLTANAETFEAKNQYGDYYAVVYMGYEPYTASNNVGTYDSYTSTRFSANYAHYTAPTVTVQASNYGPAEVVLTVGGSSETLGSTAKTYTVGTVTVETDKYTHNEWYATFSNQDYFADFYYKGDTATLLGTQTIETVTSTVGGVTYTRTLENPIVISQINQANPTLTWNAPTGTTITVKAGSTTYTDTADIPAMTSLTATVTANFGYHHPTLTAPEGAFNWTMVREEETEAVYTFQMPAGNATLTGQVSKYPAITFADGGNATVAVSVDGTSITSNTGAKPGSTVVVTVTADRDEGYCLPKLTQPSGITWTAKEGSFVSTYTFTMPSSAVGLTTPTTDVMYQLTWTGTAAVSETDGFYVYDEDLKEAIGNGGYVIPGHKLTITLTASGGMDPVLLTPSDAVLKSGTTFAATYTYTMPSSAVHLTVSATDYPAVVLDNNYASFTVFSNNAQQGYTAGTGVGVRPGYTVKVVLTAKDGWYAPQMTQPSGVTNWTVVGTPDNVTATYTFTMPETKVDATGNISATAAPAVSFAATNCTMTMSYTDYEGNAHNNVASGTKVQPGVTVTASLATNDDCYAPRLTQPSGVTEWDAVSETDWAATYTFTMGTSAVNLSASAAEMPTVSFECSSYASMSMNYTGYKGATYTGEKAGGVKVKPGSLVTATVTITDTSIGPVYDPKVEVASGTVTGFTQSAVADKTATYTFTMGSTAVTLKGSGTPSLKWTKLDIQSGTPTVKYTLNGSTTNVTVDTVTIIPAGAVVNIEVPGHYKDYWVYKDQYGGVLQNIYGLDAEKTTFADLATDSGPIYVDQKPTSGSAAKLTGKYHFVMPDNPVTFAAYHTNDPAFGCVTEDTLITLADGSQVRVDSLTGNEQLLVWNHVTGQFDTAPIAYLIDHDGKREETAVIHLYFSDGSDLEIVEEHVFYDADSGKYITLNENAADYIGNGFAKQNPETGTMDVVTLTDVVFETKVTGVYEVVTYSYMTCFTDGILTASAYIENLLNIFDIDTATMAYDPVKMQQDIETYGLYTYEDLSHIVNEEQFYMHNGPVTKVAVGKGTITHEEMMALVKLFEAYAKTPGEE